MKLMERLVRYDELKPCHTAFIDTRSPGSDKKENFTIIGPGVAENPHQHVHIKLPHGFNIGGARQPPHCLNSQHSHLTSEVFVVHSGTWAFRSGVDARDGEIILNPGDIISLPTDVFRGFENIGQSTGFLYAVLGEDDPGRVLWAPQVFDLARDHGLVLMEDGSLHDSRLSETLPEGLSPMPRTTVEQVSEHRVISASSLKDIIVRKRDFQWSKDTLLAGFDGVEEVSLLGPANEFTFETSTPTNQGPGFANATSAGPSAHFCPPSRLSVAVGMTNAGPTPQMTLLLSFGEMKPWYVKSPKPNSVPSPDTRSS